MERIMSAIQKFPIWLLVLIMFVLFIFFYPGPW